MSESVAALPGRVGGRGGSMDFNLGQWGPIAAAVAAIAAGWFTLRGSWDRKLLGLLSEEMDALRDRVKGLETETRELRKDLDQSRRENEGLQGLLRTAEVESKRLARINVKQAARLVVTEANFARIRVFCDALVARMKMLGEEVSDVPLFEDYNGHEDADDEI